jgi:hypothetical protein
MFGKSKFSLDKIKTALIRADLATSETSDSELEQTVLNLVATAKNQSAEDTEEEEEDETDAEETDDAEVNQSEAPAWFKSFEAKVDKSMKEQNQKIAQIAKAPKPSTAGEKSTSEADANTKKRAYHDTPLNKGMKF